MARPPDSKYDAYAKHRILHRVLELYPKYGSWEAMAGAVSNHRDIRFPRTYFNRLRDGVLGDYGLDVLVGWLESIDTDFRSQLLPETIFADVGTSARDYYFHLFGMEDLEEWDETLLTEFEGVYLCAPEDDPHSYLPSPYVRACMEKQIELPKEWQARRSLDLNYYISKRSFLMLRRTGAHYYHAAEVPMAALFPPEFQTLDIKTYYEGVGIASSNTIHVFLRECMTRVPKIHSIIIRPKGSYRLKEVAGGSLYAPAEMRNLADELKSLPDEQAAHMKEEFALQLTSDVFLRGTSQVNISPLPFTRNHVDTVFGTEQVYHRKPKNFLSAPTTHFIRPDLDIDRQIETLLDNPLAIGDLL